MNKYEKKINTKVAKLGINNSGKLMLNKIIRLVLMFLITLNSKLIWLLPISFDQLKLNVNILIELLHEVSMKSIRISSPTADYTRQK